jgi:hypothetical protein
MTNVFQEVGKLVGGAAKALAYGVAHLFGLGRKVEYVLKAQKTLGKPFAETLGATITDLETVLTDGQVAITDGGINIPADAAAYAAFKKLSVDAKKLLPLVEDEIAVIEGKPEPDPIPPSPAIQPEPQPQPQPQETAQQATSLHETVAA